MPLDTNVESALRRRQVDRFNHTIGRHGNGAHRCGIGYRLLVG
jgi:hypothetical protein